MKTGPHGSGGGGNVATGCTNTPAPGTDTMRWGGSTCSWAGGLQTKT